METYLLRNGFPASIFISLIFLMALSGGLIFFGYEVWKELQRVDFWTQFERSPLAVIGYTLLFGLLSTFWFLILFSLVPRKRRYGVMQVRSKWKAIVLQVLTLIWMTPFFLLFIYGLPEIIGALEFKFELSTLLPLFVGGLFLVLFLYGYMKAYRSMFNWIRAQSLYGTTTAKFEKTAAHRFRVRIGNKQSADATLRYRVHLNFVAELEVTTGGHGDDRSTRAERQVLYHEFQDVTATELGSGIEFSLPKSGEAAVYKSSFARRKSRYWEVLVEEHGGTFYERFYVPTSF